MKTNFVSINTVIDEYLDFSGDPGRLDKPMLKKIANDIITKVSTTEQDTHKISLLKIEDWRVKLPSDFKKVVQVLYRDSFEGTIRKESVVEWVRKSYDDTACEFRITKECDNCNGGEVITVDIDRQWYQAHPELQYNHMKHFYKHGGIRKGGGCSSSFDPSFRIMRCAQHNFFNTDMHVKGCLNLDEKLLVSETTEYRLDLPYLKSSEKDGWILISYLANKVDDEGYRFVPNIPEVFDAINWALEERMLYRQYRSSKDDRVRRASMDAKMEKERKIAMSKEILDTPSFDSWNAFIENNWKKVYPYYDRELQMGRAMPDQYYKNMKNFTK